MLELIINADDLGLTPGCNYGIVKAITEGIVTDTTLLVNTEYTGSAVELLRQHNIERVGLHLNLAFGRPLLPAAEVPSLIDEQGRFRRKVAETAAIIKPKEIKHELIAQVEKFLETGLGLTHLDSHYHVHAIPVVLEIVIELARELNVPLRQVNDTVRQNVRKAGVVTTEHISLDFYKQGATLENLQHIIESHQEGALEIMCHPGEPDQVLYDISSYHVWRGRELAILTSSTMRDFLNSRNVRLINFDALKNQ